MILSFIKDHPLLLTIRPLDQVANEVAEFLIHQENAHKNDLLITCQATSPFISTGSISKIRKLFLEKNADCVISLVKDKHLRWVKKKIPKNLPHSMRRD